jgi:hypothetical protein
MNVCSASLKLPFNDGELVFCMRTDEHLLHKGRDSDGIRREWLDNLPKKEHP